MAFSLWLAIVAAFFPSMAQASFLPQEALDHPHPPARFGGGVPEADFNAVITGLERSYSETVRAFGGTLSIRGNWKEEKLNAGATQMGSSWQVVITGGIARRPELTRDGFTLILCHELGHHLAGFPFAAGGNPFQKTWAANEGQADYFSTQVCARRIWAPERELNATFRAGAPELVRERCDTAWDRDDDRDLCYRISAAVKSMTDTMAGIMGKPAPDFATPDSTVVAKTSDAHPPVQCRMDTVFQAALCPQEFGTDIIPGKNVRDGVNSEAAERESAGRTCTAFSNHVFGLRPRCWYKPRF